MRDDFPALLNLDSIGRVYLDSAATAQKPHVVIDSISNFYSQGCFPLDRSPYKESIQAREFVDSLRKRILRFFNVDEQGYRVVFCSSATAAANIIFRSWVDFNVSGHMKSLFCTGFEHNASLAPAFLDSSRGWTLSLMEKKFFVGNEHEETAFADQRLGFGMLTTDSNVVGSLWRRDSRNLISLIKSLKANGLAVALDASQSVGHSKLDLKVLDPDFFFFSGHKMGGPSGTGVLIIKSERFNELHPFCMGSRSFEFYRQEPRLSADPMSWLECGSGDIADLIGLSAAFDWLDQNVDFQKYDAKCDIFFSMLTDGLRKFEDISIVRPDYLVNQGTRHIFSFRSDLVPSHDLAYSMGKRGVLLRSGQMCSDLTMKTLAIDDCVRASFFHYTTEKDIRHFLEALESTEAFFRQNL